MGKIKISSYFENGTYLLIDNVISSTVLAKVKLKVIGGKSDADGFITTGFLLIFSNFPT